MRAREPCKPAFNRSELLLHCVHLFPTRRARLEFSSRIPQFVQRVRYLRHFVSNLHHQGELRLEVAIAGGDARIFPDLERLFVGLSAHRQAHGVVAGRRNRWYGT